MTTEYKSTAPHLECNVVSATSYCGPMNSTNNRTRLQLTQANNRLGGYNALTLTKQQALELSDFLRDWGELREGWEQFTDRSIVVYFIFIMAVILFA